MPARGFPNLSVRYFLLALLSISAVTGLPPTAVADDDRPRIVAFGNSLTAGLGVAAEDAYPARLQHRLNAQGFRYRVINAGVSGDTTAGGLRAVP